VGFIYGVAAIWFFGSESSGKAHRFVSLGLMVVSLLTASIAVEPFLFAALLWEMAAMLVVPLLVPVDRKPGPGVIRFLIFQTMAMPFILFSGWMLAGVEVSLGDISLTTQAGTMLGLGFAFLFAIFPLYSWIPLLAEETNPYATGFLLWALPTFTVIFGLGFLDRYAWLRTSDPLAAAIQIAGVLMTASGGIFASTQKHIGRMLGYGAIVETGLFLISMGSRSPQALDTTFLLLLPRGVEFAVWSLGLVRLSQARTSLRFGDVKGIARQYPLACAAVVFSHLSVAGFPLLAGFPPRLALLHILSSQSVVLSFWVVIGILGLLIGGIRTLAVFVMAEEDSPWGWSESRIESGMLVLGIFALFMLGMLPQVLQPLVARLPLIFEHMIQ
jgi:NADH:ubiquinone oxidoreductase subunit 2 (subunit N)